jgi:folate-binding protein YgfZ
MFVMRAKVLISPPLAINFYAVYSQNTALTHTNHCFTLLSNGFAITTESHNTESHNINLNGLESLDWDLNHIQMGVAWINAANSEQFIPQTANFELVGGVSFRKGCYPGQEIVARSQYLGKLKQRAAIACYEINPDEGITVKILDDIFEMGKDNPVGRVILVTPTYLLFDVPYTLVESEATLCLYLKSHLNMPLVIPLIVKVLPYSILDITK